MSFEVTKTAAAKIMEIAEKENKKGHGLRVLIGGESCSGPQYQLGLEEKSTDRDNVSDQNGLKVFIDPDTLTKLTGGKLDWIEGPQGAGFKLSNPNQPEQKASGGGCGCGAGGCGSGGGCGCGPKEEPKESSGGGCGSPKEEPKKDGGGGCCG